MKSPVQSSPVQTMIAAMKCWWRWWFNEPWRRGDFIVGGFIFTPHVDIFYFSNWLVLGCSSVLSRKLSPSSSPNKNRSWIYCVILDSCFSIGQWHRRCFPSTSLFLLNERTNQLWLLSICRMFHHLLRRRWEYLRTFLLGNLRPAIHGTMVSY